MIGLSKLAGSAKPSATMAAANKARELRDAGVDVADFSVGEPDFPTPAHICDAARDAAAAGHTHYTPAAGIPELRRAVARWYGDRYGFDCSAENVVLSNGAKHSIHNALASLLGPGDEAVVPTPYWVSYAELVAMTGAEPVLVPTTAGSGFKLSPGQLRAAITPRTKLFLLNSPSNPTGAVYTRAELEALADVLLEAGVPTLSDEIYEHLTYGCEPTCFATLRPGLRDLTVTVSGVSKGYAMTGWRMGWAVAPAHVAKAMGAIQSQQTGCPCSVTQYASLAALTGPQDCVEEMRREFQARRDLTCKLVRDAGLPFPEPAGAFYVFADVSGHFGRRFGPAEVNDSAAFCLAALEQAHVNLVPGSAFGAEGFVRISFATGRQTLEAGLGRLRQFLAG